MASHKLKGKQGDKAADVNYEEDLDHIDFNNYKGIFYNDDPGQKYQDEVTGAHFEYHDMCHRLSKIQKSLSSQMDRQQINYEDDDIDGSDNEQEPIQEITVQPAKAEIKPTVLTNKKALKNLQEILARGKPKESRNATQVLPQQGYGTTGLYNKDPKTNLYPDVSNFRQFSSQINQQPPKKSSATNDYPDMMNLVNRSKSTDKQRLHGTFNKQVPMIPQFNSSGRTDLKKGSFMDLYCYWILL